MAINCPYTELYDTVFNPHSVVLHLMFHRQSTSFKFRLSLWEIHPSWLPVFVTLSKDWGRHQRVSTEWKRSVDFTRWSSGWLWLRKWRTGEEVCAHCVGSVTRRKQDAKPTTVWNVRRDRFRNVFHFKNKLKRIQGRSGLESVLICF